MVKSIDFSKYSSIKIGPVVNVKVIEKIGDSLDGYFLIGGANNLLISDTPPPLCMLSKEFDYIRVEDDKLYIGAATKSGRIFSYTKKHDIKGFEYLSKLPGTLGGLIKMNAGMKSDEIFNNLIEIKTIDGYKKKESIKYGYRFTDISTPIYEGVFKIDRGFDKIKLASFSNMRKNQPTLPSAGSIFKNPPNKYAGRLIESVGLKGFKKGKVSFSEIHANFLVNEGGAKYEDALFLINLAKQRVYNKYKIVLENEIIITSSNMRL